MARKKKKEEKEFSPSKYQLAIFDFIANCQGNLVVEAASGAGKTTTLLKSVELIDGDRDILLTAFNKDIVSTLTKKTKDMHNVNAMTFHALGLRMLKSNFPEKKLVLDEYKYRAYISNNLNKLSKSNVKKKDYAKYKNNIIEFVDYGRLYLAQTVKDLDFIAERYGIDPIADEKYVAMDVIAWGKQELDIVDYIDMIFLPNTLNCKAFGLKYDWIFVDEAQDLSVAQREILLKCCKINTRMVFFGDSNQTIYSFAGSDPESFRTLKELPNTTSLPLSISYRCAKKIVKFAQELVPSIEENDDGRVGEIINGAELSDISDGDMVLCRNNAPLMQTYVELIRAGKKCFIRGKDVGANLKRMVQNTRKELLNKDLRDDGVFVRLYEDYFNIVENLKEHYGLSFGDAVNSSIATNRLDQINALEVLSENLYTSDDLIKRIETIFSDNKKESGIALSTIHKAKGLESDNVFIVCSSLMPSKIAVKNWERRQELNLMYVAYTRAKNKLAFVKEDKFKNFTLNAKDTEAKLRRIEAQVSKVLRKELAKQDVSNPFIAREVIRHGTVIEPPKKIEKINKLVGSISNNTNIGYGNIAKKRITKFRKF